MPGEEWGDDLMKCFGMLMDGRARPTGVRQRGTEAAMLIVLNSHHDLVNFTLPEYPDGQTWDRFAGHSRSNEEAAYKGKTGEVFGVTGRSLFLFVRANYDHGCTISSRSWVATYRLQLHAGLHAGGCRQGAAIPGKLGISHVYLSPCLQATPGSQHGYDVIDPRHVSRGSGRR